MDTDEDGVTDYIELQGWDVIVIHERRGEVMEDRCKYGVWSLPVRFDSEGDGASDEIEWKFHGDPDSSDSDKDGIPDREESGPNLTMVEGTPPVILDKKGRDKSSEKYGGAYIKTKVKVKTKWSISGVKIKGKIIVIFRVIDNAGLDKAVIYVQTAGKRIICLGGDKRREIEEVFDIGDLLRLIHGGYDVRVNVTDINGNWATGKTHIDSALQTLKKGLMALLEIFKAVARVIAKVASMLINVIEKIVKNVFGPIIKSVKKAMKEFVEKVYNNLYELYTLYSQRLKERKEHVNGIESRPDLIEGLSDRILSELREAFFGPLYLLINLIIISIGIIYVIVTALTAGLSTILQFLIGFLISGIFAIGVSQLKKEDSFLAEFMGQSIIDAIIGFITKYWTRITSGIKAVGEALTRGKDDDSNDEGSDPGDEAASAIISWWAMFFGGAGFAEMSTDSTGYNSAKWSVIFGIFAFIFSFADFLVAGLSADDTVGGIIISLLVVTFSIASLVLGGYSIIKSRMSGPGSWFSAIGLLLGVAFLSISLYEVV